MAILGLPAAGDSYIVSFRTVFFVACLLWLIPLTLLQRAMWRREWSWLRMGGDTAAAHLRHGPRECPAGAEPGDLAGHGAGLPLGQAGARTRQLLAGADRLLRRACGGGILFVAAADAPASRRGAKRDARRRAARLAAAGPSPLPVQFPQRHLRAGVGPLQPRGEPHAGVRVGLPARHPRARRPP